MHSATPNFKTNYRLMIDYSKHSIYEIQDLKVYLKEELIKFGAEVYDQEEGMMILYADYSILNFEDWEQKQRAKLPLQFKILVKAYLELNSQLSHESKNSNSGLNLGPDSSN